MYSMNKVSAISCHLEKFAHLLAAALFESRDRHGILCGIKDLIHNTATVGQIVHSILFCTIWTVDSKTLSHERLERELVENLIIFFQKYLGKKLNLPNSILHLIWETGQSTTNISPVFAKHTTGIAVTC